MPTMHYVKRKDARLLGIQSLLSRSFEDNKPDVALNVVRIIVKFVGLVG